MSGRTSLRGNAMPGGRVEYRGDLPAPVSTYAYPMRNSSIGVRMAVPGTTVRTGSSVVSRKERRGGIRSFYSHGAVRMLMPVPGRPAYGQVISSPFQPRNVQLMDWQINPSWNEAGYPQNLGLSTRTPQLLTNITGGPGRSGMSAQPRFDRVQSVPRATARVRLFRTRSAQT